MTDVFVFYLDFYVDIYSYVTSYVVKYNEYVTFKTP